MHDVEVDQSGNFEVTKTDTVLAFSNGVRFSVLIPTTVKRNCITQLRKRGLTGPTLYVQLFAVGLFFLLKDSIDQLEEVVIDTEYEGREALIKDHLMNILRRSGSSVRRGQIRFGHIGKESAAHSLALATFRKNKAPDLVLTLEAILGQFRV